MKKKLSMALLSALALGLLVGCGPAKGDNGSGSASNDKKSYDLLIWEDKDKKSGIVDAVKAFEKENNVKIKVVEKAYGGQLEDLRLDGPAGTGADVITIPSDQIGTAVTEGLLKDLDVNDELKAIYSEAAMKSQIVDGKVYGLPKAVETQILFYNKDMVSESDLPKTTDEWFDLSKKFVADGKYGLLALWDQIYYAQGIMSSYGGYIFGEDKDGNYDPKDLGLASKGSIEGANYIQKFYKEGLFPSGIIGDQGINVLDSLFSEGKAAAVISGPWNLDPYKKAGVNYGVAALPMVSNGEHMSSFIGVKSYNISSYSKNAKLAEKFVKFVTDEQNSKVRYEKTLEVPAVLALENDKEVQANAGAAAIAEQAKYAELTPGITAMNSVWDPANAALQTIAMGKAEPKEALTQAVDQIKEAIAASKQ